LVLEEAIVFTETHNERAWESELYRLQGEFSLLEGQPERARAEFEKALNIASRQGSRSLELRAATSLARLRTQQGFSDEALAFLAPIYDWFTEGFDTHDLREAKTLLDRLRS
jgi:predicted ATPase